MDLLFVGTRVRVIRCSRSMSYLAPVGTEAIVFGNYPIVCGGHSYGDSQLHSYSLGIIKDGKIVNSVSWFDRAELEVVSMDLVPGQLMMQAYHISRSRDYVEDSIEPLDPELQESADRLYKLFLAEFAQALRAEMGNQNLKVDAEGFVLRKPEDTEGKTDE